MSLHAVFLATYNNRQFIISIITSLQPAQCLVQQNQASLFSTSTHLEICANFSVKKRVTVQMRYSSPNEPTQKMV